MNSRPIPPARFAADDPTRVYFWIAFVAFTAVAAGWAVNSLLSGWMEVAGVGAIGLFYLGLGMLELGRRSY
ncbi:hypothetical protein [Planctomicrobium piriforme]|nr:hypothetical protein [Planctomicrobium piriforme]